LTLNEEKCHFMVRKGFVLGCVISSDGIEINKDKIDLIANLFPLTYAKFLRSFLKLA